MYGADEAIRIEIVDHGVGLAHTVVTTPAGRSDHADQDQEGDGDLESQLGNQPSDRPADTIGSDPPGSQRQAAPPAPHPRIRRVGDGDLLGSGSDLQRDVAHDFALGADFGRDRGADPIVIAIGAAVLDHANPAATGLQRLPHIGEGRWRHIGVADQIMGLADQLLAGEATDRDERPIGVRDGVLHVSSTDQKGVLGNITIALRYWAVVAHGKFLRRQRTP